MNPASAHMLPQKGQCAEVNREIDHEESIDCALVHNRLIGCILDCTYACAHPHTSTPPHTRTHIRTHTTKKRGFMHHGPICHCEPRASHCSPSCNFHWYCQFVKNEQSQRSAFGFVRFFFRNGQDKNNDFQLFLFCPFLTKSDKFQYITLTLLIFDKSPISVFWGPFVHHFTHTFQGLVSKILVNPVLLLIVQCGKWCTNAPIFLCDGAQMPLSRS